MYAMLVEGRDDDERRQFDRELNFVPVREGVPAGLPPSHGSQALIALMKSPMGRGEV